MTDYLNSRAPGRINLIGEHVDYNDGLVLPAAIDKESRVDMRRNGDPFQCNISALDIGEELTFDLRRVQPQDRAWGNYVLGVVAHLQALGAELEGFDATFSGTVPIGGGMSSSAALECSFAVGLRAMFQLDLDDWQLIKAAQLAEHNFVGIKCGIMDQFASMMGRAEHAMLLDCRSLTFEYLPLDLGEYQFLLLNTQVSHALADSAYNTRRQQCEEGVSILQQHDSAVQSLRDTTPEMLAQSTVNSQIPCAAAVAMSWPKSNGSAKLLRPCANSNSLY